MLLSPCPEADETPFRRFFYALAASGLLRPRDYSWSGKFGSSFCPVCDQRGSLWFTDEGGEFRFGCKEHHCNRYEMLAELGLDGYDLIPSPPKWLARGKLGSE